ncbi:hypothetical protein QYE76_020356 [Lolium multiflorum]|uniref:Integrase catalytic domain-containing protein n=1 Tax=Lolium multiflorum TaxID=4521 RepID=A0AAD8VPY3_LOLMU|nr:hypothetical protein QYE76_020356 [Lolium multiflorum]
MSPCSRINEVLHPVAPAVVASTTVAPTVVHGTSGLRAAARPYSPVRRPVASCRMIATGSFFHIQPSTYHPAPSPLSHVWMVPVGTINLFVGLAGVSNPTEVRPGQLQDPYAPGQLLTATIPLFDEVQVEDESALEDDADSEAAVSVAGSIVAASLGDSITLVSYPSDYEDNSILPLFDTDSETDSVDAPRYQYPIAVLMATERRHPTPSPCPSPRPRTRPRSRRIGRLSRRSGRRTSPSIRSSASSRIWAQRRLAPYFHGHPVKVVASTPLANIILNRDEPVESPSGQSSSASTTSPNLPTDLKHWIMYFDGSKNLEGAGAGIVLISPKGNIMRYVLQLQFEPCTNNMAEYGTLLHGMRIAKEMGATRLRCFGDSDLVASQTLGTCDATDANMIAYKRAVDQAGASFAGHVVEWVDRRKNGEAEALSRLGSKRQPPLPGVFLDILTHPSVRVPREADIAEPPAPDSVLVAVVSDAGDWTEPYINYLERQVLPMDETEARMIVCRCKSFTIINQELYKRSISGVLQRCVTAEEGCKIMRDIHAGDCGHHAGARSIVAKDFRHDFYWPTAHADAVELVRACVGCQKYASQSHMLGSTLKTIPLTWPFAVWGVDMVGEFKTAPGGYTHLLVAVDKFTKWVEAKPIKKCDGRTATMFLRELIYH